MRPYAGAFEKIELKKSDGDVFTYNDAHNLNKGRKFYELWAGPIGIERLQVRFPPLDDKFFHSRICL